MSVGQVFDLKSSLGPCFIKALYWIALVLIALGLLRGIVGGVRMMGAPAAQTAMATAPDTATPPSPPGNPPDAMPGRRGPGMGMMRRRFGGRPGMHRGMRGPMMGGPMGLLRGMPPAVLGGFSILLALLRAAIMLLVVRVLAEVGNAVLAMGAKARP